MTRDAGASLDAESHPSGVTLRHAGCPGQVAAAAALFREMLAETAELYVDPPLGAIVADASHFWFMQPERVVPASSVLPRGVLVVAYSTGDAEVSGVDAALGGMRVAAVEGDVCELAAMYVRPAARRSGLGARLVTGAIGAAREAGYRVMRLSTGERHLAAVALYERHGFQRIAAPADALPGDWHFELKL
jgi:GNAT superfamily N-acetyltransferase